MQTKLGQRILTLLTMMFLQSTIALAEVQQIFFAEELKDQISRIDADGEGLTTLTGDNQATTFFPAIDPTNRKLYFMMAGLTAYEVKSISFDGDDETSLIIGTNAPGGLGLDLTNNKIYWTENSTLAIVKRANLDGTSPETLITIQTPGFTLGEIQVDPLNGFIYYVVYTASGVPQIRKAGLDGSSESTLVSITNIESVSLYFDKDNDYLYWSEKNAGLIKRILIDSGSIDTVFSDSNRDISGIAVDPDDGPRIYFAETSSNLISSVVALETTVSSVTPTSGGYSGPNHLALLPSTTLTPNVTLVDPPEVRVTSGSRTVDFVLQAFDEGSLTDSLSKDSPISKRAVNLSVRYDLTVTRSSDGLRKRRVTRNSKTSVRLPAGNYSASYNARTVSTRSSAARAKELSAANKSIRTLRKIRPQTVKVKNKLENAKARKSLASVRTRRKTNQSPSSDSFSVG